MDLIEKYNLNFSKIAKLLGLVLLAGITLALVVAVVSSVSRSVLQGTGSYNKSADMMTTTGFGYAGKGMESYAEPSLSTRNIMPEYGYTPGSDLEAFEVTEYSATIETRRLDETCETIFVLKAKDYVIFENSNKGDTDCYYRFKVKRENVEEVLLVVKQLDPRQLNENVETIKKQIDDYTSQEEILRRKLDTMDSTLNSAIVSYDEISALATQTRDAGSLASVIKSKIEIIERLSQEKINVSAQLENIARQKAEKLDRLEYTYFNINIYENKYVDVDQIKDSWKMSIKVFVTDMNIVAQDLSLGLAKLTVYTFQYLLYLLIIVIVAKYVWKLFKKIWQY